MKRLFFALFLVAGSLAVTSAHAQPYFRGRVGFGFPHPHAFFAPVIRPGIIYPPVPVPYYGRGYYGGGVVVAPPVYGYGYGYRHYAPYYHGGRGFRGRR
jgi:hypothetical protein